MANKPINQELFDRTAPAWNCVAYPGDGMHYLSAEGGCQWCGMTKDQIRAETRQLVDDPDLDDVFYAGKALGLLGFEYASTPDPAGPTRYLFTYKDPRGTWAEARLTRQGVLQRFGSLPSRLDRLYEPRKLNEAGWPAVVCGDCGSGIVERAGRNWHRDGSPQCMGRADAASRKPPGHFGPDWPAPLTWRVRVVEDSPGTEETKVIAWGISAVEAERISGGRGDSVAELDPAQVPSTQSYPEALS